MYRCVNPGNVLGVLLVFIIYCLQAALQLHAIHMRFISHTMYMLQYPLPAGLLDA